MKVKTSIRAGKREAEARHGTDDGAGHQ